MAKTTEVWIVEGVEGITRRQQMGRLAEWKKLFLAEAGASAVNIWEGGYGEYSGAWIYAVEFDSAEACGKSTDRFHANSKSFDDAMDIWTKTPMLKFRGGGLIHQANI
jgi:hypothetical protein